MTGIPLLDWTGYTLSLKRPQIQRARRSFAVVSRPASTQNGTVFVGRLPSTSCPLGPGDWVLLYTDGIPETTNPSDLEFGSERFRQFLLEKQIHQSRSAA